MGSHFKKLNLNEAEENFTLISEMLRKSLKGGCSGCQNAESMGITAYSSTEYESLLNNGCWTGGYVCGRGFMLGEVTVYGDYGEYRGYDNWCSEHKVIFFGGSCFQCNDPYDGLGYNYYGTPDYSGSGSYGSSGGDFGTGGSGSGGSGSGGTSFIPLPNRDLTNTSYFETQASGQCLQACKDILDNYGISNYGDSAHVYQLKKEVNGVLTDYGSDPAANYENAIDCINRHLDASRPIIIGINHSLDYGINEGTTDHFMLITGRGYDSEKGMYYYIYMDPGRPDTSNGCDTQNNRLYYDPDNLDFYDDSTYNKRRFDVTQVRPNDGKYLNETINSKG